MLSRECELTLAAAFREAEIRRHEFVALEHLLLAMLHHEAASIVDGCGGDVEALKADVERHLSDELEQVPGAGPYELELTTSLKRLLDRVASHVRSAEKKEATTGDLLAAIFLEEESHAAYFLRKQGLSRLEVLQAISQEPEQQQDTETPTRPGERRGRPAVRMLERYTTDLNRKARQGLIDPLVGRADEVQRVLQVLARRTKNNPILVGDAGVGKTAIVEGLADRIVHRDVPESFEKARVFALDLGAMLAGTRFRGDFEARLKGVVSELKRIPDALLFIDEIHTIVGAGATSGGSMDASNILKPLLVTGELRCMGSTTYEEYRRYFEKDHALSRRFQRIVVDEPSVDDAVRILSGLQRRYEEHHGVRYAHRALRAAVELSARHVPDRRLPDKAIDVIDEAGAVVKLRNPKPGRIITTRDVQQVIARMTRRPLDTIGAAERNRVQGLEERLRTQLFGQDAAITQVARAVRRSRAGLGDPQRPIASYLLVGPSGVGKTELARQLADGLGVELLRYDMSEYMEKHTVSRLIGAPPGYVGYDSGGLLTDAVIKSPHAVLLLDEVEKAHPDVFDLLLQIMDYATLTDANGRKADFHHCVLLMTSNAGAREMSATPIGFADQEAGPEEALGAGQRAVKDLFRPEFTNRLDGIVTFAPLSPQDVERIVDKYLAQLNQRLAARRVSVALTEAARNMLATKGYDPWNGARPLARLFETAIHDPLTDELLAGSLQRNQLATFDVQNDQIVLIPPGQEAPA